MSLTTVKRVDISFDVCLINIETIFPKCTRCHITQTIKPICVAAAFASAKSVYFKGHVFEVFFLALKVKILFLTVSVLLIQMLLFLCSTTFIEWFNDKDCCRGSYTELFSATEYLFI